MSDMKCPYCDKPLHCGAQLNSDGNIIELYQCANPECESTEFLVGCKEFWDILGQHKRTRNALDYATEMLTRIAVSPETMLEPEKIVPQLAGQAIEQINEIKGGKDDV